MPKRITRKHTATYVYRDKAGEKVVKKLRYSVVDSATGEESKDFRVWNRPDPEDKPNYWEPSVGAYGGQLLYRLPQLLEAKARGEDLFWCEGEKDARTAYKAWGIATTTHHQGGAGARFSQAEWFAGSSGVIWIVFDRDATGMQLADHHVRLLRKWDIPRSRIGLLFPAVTDDHADLTDHIEAGWGLDDLRELPHKELRHIIDRIGPLPRGRHKSGRWGSGGTAR
ncbi:hypothetical protein [Actinomadura montaniterrae]|uniref:Toprim domain-containing protein n=1 Tax=Actinomadura montaniterrae TaxID=1803903 RepID=A0A6L3VP73_9ACTN|nr:hypothetical protein [Actinomadura montaniterrae]KAB2372049.1 hypothetical protein F9B16_30755 [Actinomadura montaniterrae]